MGLEAGSFRNLRSVFFLRTKKNWLIILIIKIIIISIKIVVITATATTVTFPAHTPSAEGHFQAPLARKKSLFSKDQFSISYIIIKFIVQFGQMNCQIKWCFLSIANFVKLNGFLRKLLIQNYRPMKVSELSLYSALIIVFLHDPVTEN